MHVTMKVVEGLPNLRSKKQLRAIEHAFVKSAGRFGMNLAHYSIQHILRTPSEVRAVLACVLQNRRKHERARGKWVPRRDLDACSSARYFTGWKDLTALRPDGDPPVLKPRTWLLKTGWKLRGLIPTSTVPGS
ncbi:MAG: hypothetical protein IT371_15810 [Deltaproteobacteria bacterium]|nr:hypothetical protein [Deltaproteobacteria bacterium]